MINTHFTISGISIQIVGHQPQGITMHEKAVALRIVDGNGTPGGNGITRQFVVEAIITGKHILVYRIIHLHVIKGFAIPQLTVVEQAVTHQFLTFVGQNRTVQQFRLLGNGVIYPAFRIDMIFVADNIGRSQNRSDFRFRTVFQRIGSEDKLRIHQLHLMVEHSQFGGRTVFSPFGSQYVFFIGQRTAIKIIA